MQRGELGGDLGRAARGGEELEVQRDERRVALDEVLERGDERGEQVVGGARVGERGVERGEADVGVAPDDLDQQPLLGAEVVVQQPARDARLAGHVVERRARRAARATDARIASTIRCALSPLSVRVARLHRRGC